MNNEQRILKRKIKHELEIVMLILHEWDPILRPYNVTGPIADHTPFYEYGYLADRIISIYHEWHLEEKIFQTIKKGLSEYFGIDRTDKEIAGVTKLIWQSLNTFD
ncbi:MAG: hypothetical protein ABSH16_04135 [Sedimentisphaerales bacterium]